MSKNGPARMFIHAISTATPEPYLRTSETVERLGATCINRKSQKLMQRIVPHTRIEKRHFAAMDYQAELTDPNAMFRPAEGQPHGPGMNARTAAFEESSDRLVRRLLAPMDARFLARIETLITVSCTHASAPGLERPVFAHSSVPASVDRWNLGFMGCSAALAALRLTHRAAGAARSTLIVACELSSLHFQYTDEVDQMTANLLFADGAAAMVLSPEPSSVCVQAAECASLPESADQMIWWAGDRGLQLRLSNKLPETIGAALPTAIESFLDRAGVRRDQIDHWLVHPGGPQILDSVESALGLRADALDLSRAVLREYGNMSSATIVFILDRLLKSGATGKVMLLAFGPGLTIEMTLLNVSSD